MKEKGKKIVLSRAGFIFLIVVIVALFLLLLYYEEKSREIFENPCKYCAYCKTTPYGTFCMTGEECLNAVFGISNQNGSTGDNQLDEEAKPSFNN